jgi:hypothetical protein
LVEAPDLRFVEVDAEGEARAQISARKKSAAYATGGIMELQSLRGVTSRRARQLR